MGSCGGFWGIRLEIWTPELRVEVWGFGSKMSGLKRLRLGVCIVSCISDKEYRIIEMQVRLDDNLDQQLCLFGPEIKGLRGITQFMGFRGFRIHHLGSRDSRALLPCEHSVPVPVLQVLGSCGTGCSRKKIFIHAPTLEGL